jgi:hypothetical protein
MSRDEEGRICQAAEGYADLGLVAEAWELLDSLPIEAKLTKLVIALQVKLLVKAQEFLKASFLAETLCRMGLDDPENLVLVAELRFRGGDARGALEWLEGIMGRCENSADFHYLKAQCQTATGDIEGVKDTLHLLGQRWPELRLHIIEDPSFNAIFGAG